MSSAADYLSTAAQCFRDVAALLDGAAFEIKRGSPASAVAENVNAAWDSYREGKNALGVGEKAWREAEAIRAQQERPRRGSMADEIRRLRKIHEPKGGQTC